MWTRGLQGRNDSRGKCSDAIVNIPLWVGALVRLILQSFDNLETNVGLPSGSFRAYFPIFALSPRQGYEIAGVNTPAGGSSQRQDHFNSELIDANVFGQD
jgi:hypothetical protein